MTKTTMKATKKHLIGRKIVDVDWGRFFDGRGGVAHQPTLYLDNGRRVWFSTRETDIGEYGTEIQVSKIERRRQA